MKKAGYDKILPCAVLSLIILVVWETVVYADLIKRSVFPAPSDIVKAVPKTIPRLVLFLPQTVLEAAIGFFFSLIIAFVFAILMDRFRFVERAVSPLLVVSQAMPIFTLAPLFIIWFGFGILPKIIIVVLVCSFPILTGLFEGIKSAPADYLNLMRSYNAGYLQTLFHVKIPSSVPSLFSGLKIAGAYCVTGAVIGEWLGGDVGLGALMIKYKQSYSYDKMFVVVLTVCLLSVSFYGLISVVRKTLLKKF